MSKQTTFNVYGKITIEIDEDIDASNEREAIQKVFEELKDIHRFSILQVDASDLCADEYDEDE